MKIHLVDGTYELFRAFYSRAPDRLSPDGRSVGAAWGLFRTLIALLKQPDVTHVAVAFDTVIESFRNDLFDGYKSGAGVDPKLMAQFPLAEQVADALGLVVWPMREFEADDALAAGAARYAADPSVDQILLCSPDKDLAQCVEGDRIVCLNRRTDEILNAQGVIDKFGVRPASIPDYLALVGDSADGIPGVPRWGAKSTAAVLAHYHQLEAIPADHDDWAIKVRGAKALAANLREQRDDALLYRTLATLRTDAPITPEGADLAWRGVRDEALERLDAELGFGVEAAYDL